MRYIIQFPTNLCDRKRAIDDLISHLFLRWVFAGVPNHLTPAQIRGARGMLGWCMLDLAKAAGVSVSTVKRMEMAERPPMSDGIRADIKAAFEAAGIRFLADMGEETGLRLNL